MSRVYFHTIDGEAEIRGSERAMFGNICSSMVTAIRWQWEYAPKRIAAFASGLRPNHYLKDAIRRNDNRISSTIDTFLQVNDGELFEEISLFEVSLNTALLAGGDAFKLAARIHGACEIHTWCDGHNKLWLSGIIEHALQSGIYRGDAGWQDAIALLRKDTSSPMVMSYSVCDGFPNPGLIAEYADLEDPWEVYGKLNRSERWDKAMIALRAENGLEIKPDDWDSIYFGKGWDIFKLNQLIDWIAFDDVDPARVFRMFDGTNWAALIEDIGRSESKN